MAKKVFTSESLATFVDAIKTYVGNVVSTKANKDHIHEITDVTNLHSALGGKSDIGHNHNDIYYTESEVDSKLSTNLSSAKTYADGLNTVIDTRMDAVESKLNSVASGAEVNQNAFANVVVGSTTIAADAKSDSLTIAAGIGVSVSGDATNDKVTITNSGVRSVSTGGSNGTISVNTNGTSANISVKGLGSAAYTASTAYDAAGTAQAKADAALDSAKTYADGIKNDLLNGAGTAYDTLKELGDLINANVNAIDALETVASSKASAGDLTSHTGNKSNPHGVTLAQLGVTATAAKLNIMDGVTATAAELNKLDGVTATTAELNYVDGVTSNIQTQLDSKQTAITGGASTIASSNLTASRALVSDGSGKVGVSAVTSTELGYLDGVTSSVQSQLDSKSPSGHTHYYAGSSSVGGAATSANKLNTNAGDANTPVYFNNGVPVACTSLDLNTSGNAATATQLATARTIGLSTGVVGTPTSFNGTSNIAIPVTQVNEAYLSWGGKNVSGGVTPIDAASSYLHSANRFQFAKAAGITIEYSRDGSTWVDYGASDAVKQNLVSGIGAGLYIGNRNTSTTVNDKLRITLDATSMGLYTRLRKLLINISTNYAGGSNVIIEKSMKGSTNTFSTIGTYTISGWSGWNSIPIGSAFGGGDSQTGNIAKLRLIFGITSVNSEQTSNALTILDIIGIGDTYWSYPSNMAKTGHLYSYDNAQNATFPAKVTASGGFVGSLSGNATSATTASACTGNSATATKLASSKTISLTGDVTGSASFDGSANANITATVADDSHNHVISNVDGLQSALDEKAASGHTHTAATASSAGFMSATDKSKLDGIASGANKTTVDSALSSTSTNPVQNKVVNSALAGKAPSSHTHDYLPLSGGTITGSLIINNITDVGSGFAGGEPLVVGDPSGYHIAFDGTEMQCKSNATTAGNISINYDGGDVGLGGGNGRVVSRVPMYFPNETVVYGQDTDGAYISAFTAASFDDNTAVGYDRYHKKKGDLNLYGNNIKLWSNEAGLHAQSLGVNKILWEGGYLMTADHTATLEAGISAQLTGVVLVWSCYSGNTVQNFGYATHFIPKWFVQMHGGSGMDFPLMRQSAGKVGSKYLYIHDDKIVGQANNAAAGSANGITYDNGYWVLRAVIGV